MAKVTGPLMSMDASGAFGGTMVFGKWKGRPTVRQLVIPANPQTTGQQASRNAIAVLGAGQFFANHTALSHPDLTLADKVELTAAAPSGQAWNGFLVSSAIGKNLATYTAAAAVYDALTAPQKTAWDDAAAAVVPAIPAVPQTNAGGAAGTPITSGRAFFHYVYGLFAAGLLDTAPGAVPPTYA